MSADNAYEALLGRLNPILESQAWAIAEACMYLYHIFIDWQDLAQAARIYVWQYQARRGEDVPINLLLTLARLRMYGERQRGSSVLRPHPGKRSRIYERSTLAQADAVGMMDLEPSPSFTDEQEQAFLLTCLDLARTSCDDEAEHTAILILRRFARATGNANLYHYAHEQWRAWRRRKREPGLA
jgi:hypothetical protein